MKKLIYWNEEKTDNVKMKKEDKSTHKTLQHNDLWWECNGNRK